MRLTSGQLSGLLPTLSSMAVLAFHGEGQTNVRDAIRIVVESEFKGDTERFGLTSVETCEATDLRILLASRSFGGGRTVVVVSDASDSLSQVVQGRLGEADGALLLLGLQGRMATSSLAGAIAAAAVGAVIECVGDLGSAESTLEAVFGPLGISITDEGRGMLFGWSASHTQSLSIAALSVALSAGPGGTIDAQAMGEFTGDGKVEVFGQAIRRGLSGDVAALDGAVRDALADGQSGVGLLRQALGVLRFGRLAGSAAVADCRSDALWQAERLAKRTGFPSDLIAGAAVRALARW